MGSTFSLGVDGTPPCTDTLFAARWEWCDQLPSMRFLLPVPDELRALPMLPVLALCIWALYVGEAERRCATSVPTGRKRTTEQYVSEPASHSTAPNEAYCRPAKIAAHGPLLAHVAEASRGRGGGWSIPGITMSTPFVTTRTSIATSPFLP